MIEMADASWAWRRAEVAGLVLAGGRARRMGGMHKAFLALDGKPLIAHVVERLRPQVSLLAISANARRQELETHARPVLPDPPGLAHAGPLAGVLAGLEWLRAARPECHWLATAAVDTPFFPRDVVARLREAAREAGASLACVKAGGRPHPTFALWSTTLTDALRHALMEGRREMIGFMRAARALSVDFHDDDARAFFNINVRHDLERIATGKGGER